jgi:ABC-type uncharacterized transport system substrate-binding protein
MKRRQFITLLGGTAAAWPLAARAQQAGGMRRIGVLMGYGESDPAAQALVAAYKQMLKSFGWRDGRNLRLDVRWALGDVERTRKLAEELVELQPDVIFANTTPVTRRAFITLLFSRHRIGRPIVLARPTGSAITRKTCNTRQRKPLGIRGRRRVCVQA